MTKRWLSLVLVLTLLSTLFTGVAFAALTSNAPEITVEPATTDTNGPKRVTITSKNTSLAEGVTEEIYYTIQEGSAPADPTTNSEPYTAPFEVSKAGTWYVKAVSYLYKGAETAKSEVATPAGDDYPFTIAGEATKVVINQTAPVITGSGSLTFTATVTPASKAADLKWKVEDEQLTGYSDSGNNKLTYETLADGSFKVTVKGQVGTFKVKATADGKDDDVLVVVNPANITDLQMDTAITVAEGEVVELKGIPVPAGATYQELKASAVAGTGAVLVSTPEVDEATGENTFRVTGKTKGTATITVTAFNYSSSSTSSYKATAFTRKVTVTVTDPTNTAPAPSFSAADGKVFTTKNATVSINKNFADSSNSYLETQYSLDQNGSWKKYESPIPVPNNGSITIWAKNVVVSKGTGNPYESDSEVVKATFTSEIAVDSVNVALATDTSDYIKNPVIINGAGSVKVLGAVGPVSYTHLGSG